MNANRDRLDEAIDQVAARLTSVEETDDLAMRIVAALPERSGGVLSWLIPRLAISAVLGLATALVVLRTFDDRSTDVLRPGVISSPAVEESAAIAAPEHRTYREPSSNVRRTIVEPSSDDRRTLDVPDFDRSLPALEAPSALSFDSLAPVSLPEDALLTLAPLAIADLPLTADSFSPR